MGKITMFNPQSGVTQQASEDAYSRLYAGQGWQIVDTPPEPEPEVDTDLDALRAEADQLGISYHANAKADSIRKKIEDHKAAEAQKHTGS